MIKIEVLFPEVCNLFGNMYNIKYIEQSCKDVEIINTSLTDEPKFITQDINLVYMAPMTEKTQEIVIKKLKPYTEKIKEKIKQNQVFLIIGNALEIFGKYIQNEDESKIEALGITGLYAKREMMNRYNSLYLGTFDLKMKDKKKENSKEQKNTTKIVGFKAQFSNSYGINKNNYLFKTIKEYKMDESKEYEGIRINNFIGTYILGPLLVFNPEFTTYLLKLIGEENPKLEYEKEITNCYDMRLKEFENSATNYE